MTTAAPSFRIQSRLAPLVEAWSGLAAFLEKGAGAALDLAIRFWLAMIFFMSGMLKTVNWDVTVFLYANEHPVPGLAPTTAALIGTGIELVCPILLVFGLATRFAAIPLLLTAAFLQFTYKDLADHLYWMALLPSAEVAGRELLLRMRRDRHGDTLGPRVENNTAFRDISMAAWAVVV